jgi:hypothetical protein
VSNISGGYKDIFDKDMIYSNSDEMINMITNNVVNYNYIKPNRDILTISYWLEKMNIKINELKNEINNNIVKIMMDEFNVQFVPWASPQIIISMFYEN